MTVEQIDEFDLTFLHSSELLRMVQAVVRLHRGMYNHDHKPQTTPRDTITFYIPVRLKNVAHVYKGHLLEVKQTILPWTSQGMRGTTDSRYCNSFTQLISRELSRDYD